MNTDRLEVVQTALAAGKTKEQIYKSLLTKGWSVDEITAAFAQIESQTTAEDAQKRTIYYVVLAGAVLIGVGIFSFIASNWQLIGPSMKVMIIVLAMIATYSLGWWLREVQKFTKSGNALIFLGSLIYGGGIFLVGQIFHISANWPDGFILWMLGSIAMALAVQIYQIFGVALFAGLIAVTSYPGVLLELMPGHDPALLTSTFLLFIATAACFIAGWTIRQTIKPELEEVY